MFILYLFRPFVLIQYYWIKPVKFSLLHPTRTKLLPLYPKPLEHQALELELIQPHWDWTVFNFTNSEARPSQITTQEATKVKQQELTLITKAQTRRPRILQPFIKNTVIYFHSSRIQHLLPIEWNTGRSCQLESVVRSRNTSRTCPHWSETQAAVVTQIESAGRSCNTSRICRQQLLQK